MTLRERLLALLHEPNYSPANESELLRQLGLNKKRRASVAHELRLMLSQGEAIRSPDNRIRPVRAGGARQPKSEAKSESGATRPTKPEKVSERKIFSPTRRGASSAPASSATLTAAPKATARKESSAKLADVSLGRHELIGRIQFRAGGSAFVIPENPATGSAETSE